METRGWLDRLADHTKGILVLMSDVVPITAWLTYQQVAERLGLPAPAPQRPERDAGNGPAGPETTRWRRKSASRPKCLPPARRSRVNDGSRGSCWEMPLRLATL